MRWGILIVFAILAVILVSGCIVQIAAPMIVGTSIQSIQQNPESYVNKRVTVFGSLGYGGIITDSQGYKLKLKNWKEGDRSYDYQSNYKATGILKYEIECICLRISSIAMTEEECKTYHGECQEGTRKPSTTYYLDCTELLVKL